MGVPCEKQLVPLATQTVTQCFSSTRLVLQYVEGLYVSFPFCHTVILKRWILKGCFNEVNIFYSRIEDINSLLLFRKYLAIKNPKTTYRESWVPLP